MKKNIKFLFGFAGIILLSGCTSFSSYGPMPDDNLTDEANMPYVAQSMKNYEERLKFKRPVTIRMSEKGHRFLSPDRRAASQFSLEMRKDMMASAEAKLVSIVSGLRDFEIVNSESSLRTAPGATITRAPAAPAASGPYIFTFNISNVELKDVGNALGTVADIASPFVDRKITSSAKKIHWYYADVTLEINLTAPDGKNVFTFSESTTYTKSFPTKTPDVSLLKDAVAYAVERAMSRYATQFGPPLHVDQMRGNGLFVRLSAGREYGISKGHRVRFFRNVLRKVPTLPGQPEKFAVSKQLLRDGVVGERNAPVEKDHAWVFVKDNDDPQTRSVFVWTSAELAEQ